MPRGHVRLSRPQLKETIRMRINSRSSPRTVCVRDELENAWLKPRESFSEET